MFIGKTEIKGQVFLAPMAGATDAPFRSVCTDFGAACTVTEMVSSKAIQFNDKKTAGLFDISTDEMPIGIQLFGDDPLIMALAAEKVAENKPAFIDINMGCPVPKIVGNNCGSALMKNPELCGKIVAEMKRAVNIPVTVKIRSGWDKNNVNAVEIAKICENSGAGAVFLHARTREQMYKPYADWSIIKNVKEAVSIPIIGNGDVVDAVSAAKMIDETGCDAIMVGRAALGNPWIFMQINACLRDEVRIMPPATISQKIIVIRRHIGALVALKGEYIGMRESRKHVAWYLHGANGAADFRRRAGMLSTMDELDALLKDIYLQNRD